MRTVLHVLPHPGGGGERYVDALVPMDGYSFQRMFLASSAKPTPAVLRTGIRVQLAARRHDLLHVHGEVASTICLPSLAFGPSVMTLHGLNLVRRLRRLRRSLAEANLRLLVRAASRTICVSQREYDDVLAVVGAEAAQRLVMIRNGVGPLPGPTAAERAAIRAELDIPAQVVAGVLVGDLEQHKDPLVPVRATARVAGEAAPLVLIVVGDGRLRAEVEQVAAEAAVGTIRVLGFRADIDRILAAADFFVLSSQREGLSFALLEAMSLGLPCVISDAPGSLEAVGDTGIVARRGDVGSFAEAFRRLLDPDRRLALGAQARDRASREFSAGEMVRQTRQVYDGVLRSSS